MDAIRFGQGATMKKISGRHERLPSIQGGRLLASNPPAPSATPLSLPCYRSEVIES